MTESQIDNLKKTFKLQQRTSFLQSNYLDEAVNIVNCIVTNPLHNNTK
jgi:hypothetical protein